MENNFESAIKEIIEDEESVICVMRLIKGNDKACLEFTANGNSFEEVKAAMEKFIVALQSRFDNEESCPFHPTNIANNL